MTIPARTPSVPADRIVQSILRGHRVMLDSELANLYGVATKVLLPAVKRNSERFPEDFMLRLTVQEWEFLRSQSVTLKTGSGRHRKYLPYAFTEQGVPCCPQCYAAHERSRSTFRSCAPSFGCAPGGEEVTYSSDTSCGFPWLPLNLHGSATGRPRRPKMPPPGFHH